MAEMKTLTINDITYEVVDDSARNDIQTLFNSIGSPRVASLVSEMTDTDSVYVYVGSEFGYTYGNWYYYDGSDWVAGGVYNAVAVDDTLSVSGAAADAATVGDEFDDLKTELESVKTQTWNLWDGSWGFSQADPVTGTSVIYLAFGPAIDVTGGNYYSFGLVDNPLPSKVMAISIRWYDSNDTRISFANGYRLGGYLKFLQAPANAVKAAFVFSTNDASVAITPDEIKEAGFKAIIANGLVNHSNRDSAGLYAIDEDEWIPSYLIDENSIEQIATNIVTVGATNSNYTSLRSAIDAINSYGNASEKNRYEIQIKEGTYDISTYYTSAEKAVSGFIGLTVPDWVTLKGVGNREKTVLQYVLDSADSHICVLNLQNTCSIENLTLYGVNTRYCVHDDKANTSGTAYERYCKNVHFKGDTMTYGAVYGAGINSNATWKFEDCIFESLTESSYQNSFSVHGSYITQVGSNSIEFDNCRFIGNGTVNNSLILSSMSNTAGYFQNYCKLRGCSADGRLILREENATNYGSGITWWATGFATSFTSTVINNTDGEDYSANVNII